MFLARHPDMTVILALFLPLGTSVLNALGHWAVRKWVWLTKVHDVTKTLFPDPAGLVIKILSWKLGIKTYDSTNQIDEKKTPTLPPTTQSPPIKKD